MACGHNGKPTDLEATLLTIHLGLAGFLIIKPNDQITNFTQTISANKIEKMEIELRHEPMKIDEDGLNSSKSYCSVRDH